MSLHQAPASGPGRAASRIVTRNHLEYRILLRETPALEQTQESQWAHTENSLDPGIYLLSLCRILSTHFLDSLLLSKIIELCICVSVCTLVHVCTLVCVCMGTPALLAEETLHPPQQTLFAPDAGPLYRSTLKPLAYVHREHGLYSVTCCSLPISR